MKNLKFLICLLFIAGSMEMTGQCVNSDADPLIQSMTFVNDCFPEASTNNLIINWGISQNPFNVLTFANVTSPAGAWGINISFPQTLEYTYVVGSVTNVSGPTDFTWYWDPINLSLRGYSNSTVIGLANGTVQLQVLGATNNICAQKVSNAEIFIAAPGEDMFFAAAQPCLNFQSNDTNNDNQVSDAGVDQVVPVVLANFEAEATDCNEVALNWTTVAEVNNSHFEILRSYDGRSFETIAIVEGNGTTSEAIDYNYTDRDFKTQGEFIYYSLRQVDFDGSSQRFENRSVENTCEYAELSLEIYPNPTAEELNLSISDFTNIGKQANVYISSADGQLAKKATINSFGGEAQLNLEELKPGMYLLKLITEYHIMEKRFIKIK